MKTSYLPTLLLLLPFAACDPDDTSLVDVAEAPAVSCDPTLELDCLQRFIDIAHATDRSGLWYVRTQCVDGEAHYLMDTGAPAYDGEDFIVNSACDTVCTVGGWVEPACAGEYDRGAWEEVWRG